MRRLVDALSKGGEVASAAATCLQAVCALGREVLRGPRGGGRGSEGRRGHAGLGRGLWKPPPPFQEGGRERWRRQLSLCAVGCGGGAPFPSLKRAARLRPDIALGRVPKLSFLPFPPSPPPPAPQLPPAPAAGHGLLRPRGGQARPRAPRGDLPPAAGMRPLASPAVARRASLIARAVLSIISAPPSEPPERDPLAPASPQPPRAPSDHAREQESRGDMRDYRRWRAGECASVRGRGGRGVPFSESLERPPPSAARWCTRAWSGAPLLRCLSPPFI